MEKDTVESYRGIHGQFTKKEVQTHGVHCVGNEHTAYKEEDDTEEEEEQEEKDSIERAR